MNSIILGRHVCRASDVEVVGAREIIAARDDRRAEVGENVGITATANSLGRLHTVGRTALSRPRDKHVVAVLTDRGAAERRGIGIHWVGAGLVLGSVVHPVAVWIGIGATCGDEFDPFASAKIAGIQPVGRVVPMFVDTERG